MADDPIYHWHTVTPFLHILSLISCTNFICTFVGVLDEILNRLKFHTPVGATILQNGGVSKPAMHFIDENDKLQSELKVKKGMC
jgi:hypothetical protein